jgi:plastocyanin
MNRFRRLLVACAILVSGLALVPYIALPSGKFGWRQFAGAYQPEPFVVSIQDFAFVPNNLVIPVGAAVRWKNEGSVEHTVTSSPTGPLDSGQIPAGERFEFTFTAPGTYTYICSNHPSMTGKVIVTLQDKSIFLPLVSR